MSYTKKTWTAGQKVKSADLNNMEGGIDAAVNPFVVTLTPTAQDFSGTMDKTCGEINEAYEAGKTIIFRFIQSVTDSAYVPCTFVGTSDETYHNFGGNVVLASMNALINLQTGLTDDATKATYLTTIYPLTPMT